MSNHRLVLTHEQDWFKPTMVCDAPPEARCKWLPECDCESWGVLEQDSEGWYHLVEVEVEDADPEAPIVLREVKHRHFYKDDQCNYLDWFQDESIIAECTDETKTILIGQIEVDFVWEGDYYSWKAAQ